MRTVDLPTAPPRDVPEATQVLRSRLATFRLRVRGLLCLRGAASLISLAAGAMALTVLLLRLGGVWFPALAPAALLALGCGLVAAGVWLRPLNDLVVARDADHRLALRDRLPTALEVLGHPAGPGMAQAVLEDAASHLRRVRPRDVYPLRFSRLAHWAPACLLALLLVQLLPIPPLFLSTQQRSDREFLKQQATLLKPVVKRLTREAELSRDPDARQVARRLEKLRQDLQRGRLSHKQALLALSDREKDLQRLAERTAPQLKTAGQAAEEMAQAGREALAAEAASLAHQAQRRGQSQATRKLQQLARQAAKAKTPQQMRQLGHQLQAQARTAGLNATPGLNLPANLSEAFANSDYQAAAQQLAALQQQLKTTNLTPQQLQQLAKQLQQLAKTAQQANAQQLAQCMNQASQCLRQGNPAGACQSLAKAGQGQGAMPGALPTAARAASQAMAAAGRGASGEMVAENSNGLSQGGSNHDSGLGIGPDNGSNTLPRNAPAATLYAPRKTDLPTQAQRVPAFLQRSGQPMPAVTVRGAPSTPGRSRVPYYEVLPGYSHTAEEALAREAVPPAYRESVKEYFQSLEGQAGNYGSAGSSKTK